MKQEPGSLQVGVKALIMDREGKILLLQRNPVKYAKTAGLWDIPGGRIDPGSPLLDNLKREVNEETALKLDINSLNILSAQDILLEDRHIVRITYLGKANGAIKLDKEENVAFKWVSPETALKMKDLDAYLRSAIEKQA